MENLTRRATLIGIGAAAVAATAGLGGPAADAATKPTIALSPSSGAPGTAVTVTGTGFPVNAAGTVACGGVSVSVGTAKNGSFTTSLAVPSTTQPSLTVSATVGRSTASTAFTLIAAVPPVSAALPRFGVAVPGGASSSELDAVSRLVGEAPSIVLGYYDFQQTAPIADLDAIHGRGATPLITWEPWVAGAGVDQPAYSLAQIAGGAYDAYIRQWGAAIASWGKPLMLRFAHEMNGNWYPWCEAVNGNKPGDYVHAWQHVHDLLAEAGTTNITRVWGSNGGGVTDPAELYPGNGYVDAVGLDAYNWGTTQSWSIWQNPDALFGPYLTQLRGIAPGKQLLVTETASTEVGGSKPDWNTALIPYLLSQPDVSGFVWFDFDKETDWRIDSTSASATALANALAARR